MRGKHLSIDLLRLLVFATIIQLESCLPSSVFDTKQPGTTIMKSIRVGQSQTIDLPYNFTNYVSVDVADARLSDDDSGQLRRLCRVKQPGIEVEELAYQPLSFFQRSRDIIIDYNDLLKLQEVLDVYILQENIYVALSTGVIRVFNTDAKLVDGSFANVSYTHIEGFSEDAPLHSGYFVEVKDKLLFVGDQVALAVQTNSIQLIRGYFPSPTFQSVDYEDELKLLAVVEGPNGISLYTVLDQNNVVSFERIVVFTQSSSKTALDLSDVVGYNGSLYALDRNSGLLVIQLNRTQPRKSTIEPISRLTQKTGCENLHRSQHKLFVSCPDILRIDLLDGTTYAYPQSEFHIKNLIVAGELLVASGDNLIKIYRNENIVAFYQEFHLDRVAVSDQLMVIATELGIAYLNWTFTEPVVSCGLELIGNSHVQGSFETSIRAWADCDKQYLEKELGIAYQKKMDGVVCLYHFPLVIDLWQGRQFDTSPIKLIVAIVMVGLLVLAACFVMARSKIKQLTDTILKYSTGSKLGKVQYNDLVEEKHESVIEGPPSVTESALTDQKDPKNVLVHHDIE